MSRFSPRERSVFLALKAVCYSGLGTAELLATLGDRLGAVLRAEATCMMQLDPDTTLPVYVVSRGWSDEDHRPLIEHALLVSAAADPGRLLQQARRTVPVDELVDHERPYYRDPYFEYHLSLHGYRHELQTVCAAGQRGRAFLTMTRRAGAGSFEPRHARLLDALAPHVAAGIQAAATREALQAPLARSVGVIMLDERGEVELANTPGERWLSTPDAPGRPGRVWALHVLAGLLRRSLSEDAALEVPEIEMADPRSGALHRLRAERVVGADGAPRSIILLEPSGSPSRVETLLRLGLTRREAEVCLGVLRGASLDLLALETGLSAHTVRQHLRSAFAKLGVSSRREVMLRFSPSF